MDGYFNKYQLLRRFRQLATNAFISRLQYTTLTASRCSAENSFTFTAPEPWTETEFEQLDLGDARLNKGARILMERFTADPTASVPKACRSWGETMAAYRFRDNNSIDWRATTAPHWQQTQQRMAEQSVVLCLQDTTELDFNGQGAPRT